MRALHALLTVALVVAVVAVPVGTAATVDRSTPPAVDSPAPGRSPVAPQAETPALDGPVEVLALADGVANRSATHEAVLDVGPSVSAAAAASSHELVTTRAVARVRDADDPDAALADELGQAEARADALGRSQRAALGAFAAGEADARETLLALVEIDRAARALDERRERLVAAASDRGATVPEERSAALARELDIYTGPVRARVAAALTGDAPATRTYVATTPRGVTLAVLTESGYVRETYRGELRRTGGDPLDDLGARRAVAAAYPSVWSARQAVDSDAAGVSTVRVTYDGGELAATVGAANRRVFRDVHRQSFGVAGTDTPAVNTRDGLRLTVNRSYAGGPMRVRLETEDGEAVNASLTVGPEGGNSVPVGSTGQDGERWVLAPSERFTVVAIDDQSVVFITMDPLPPPRTRESQAARSDDAG